MSFLTERKVQISTLLAAATVTALNYLANTPLILVASLPGLAACYYAAKKLKRQFDIPLAFVRREKTNYWGGAFGGLIGGISGIYGATRSFEQFSVLEFGAELSLITIFLVLACLLFMGTVLKDIEDGYIEI